MGLLLTSIHSKWRPKWRTIPEVLISQLLYKTATPFQRLTPNFRDPATHISASRPDSNAVPTANPPFSGSTNSAALLTILPDVSGSQNSKMAAAKPEVLISQLLDQLATPFQRLPHTFSGSSNSMALL